ncbi:MAG TPA: glutamate racemase [Clostridiales bacterium]|nr:glutamate racemase [Clostridiales bacterium]
MTPDNNSFIAVIDSGVGGISVLCELIDLMPWEHYVYFGDSIHAPYGTKSAKEIRALTLKITKNMLQRGAKAIVVACNTATSAAVRTMRELYPHIPIIGIEPAVKPASMISEHPTVVVMATPATLHLEKFHHLMSAYSDKVDMIPLACPGLVELIEEGKFDGPEIEGYLHALFAPYHEKQIDAVVLGCTHYPHIKAAIAKAVGNQTAICDGGRGTAAETKRRLEAAGLSTDRKKMGYRIIENSAGEEKVSLCMQLLSRHKSSSS